MDRVYEYIARHSVYMLLAGVCVRCVCGGGGGEMLTHGNEGRIELPAPVFLGDVGTGAEGVGNLADRLVGGNPVEGHVVHLQAPELRQTSQSYSPDARSPGCHIVGNAAFLR